MNSSDVIVIGGGLIGLLSARELALAGLKVRILEKGSIGQEASWAGGGILSPLYPWRYRPEINQLARWSQQRYPALVQDLLNETGVDAEYNSCGLLMLDMEEADSARAWSDTYPMSMEVCDPARLAELEPAVASFPGGLWFSSIAHVRNPRLLKAVRLSAENAGVQITENIPVDGFLTTQQRVTGVRCGQEDYYAAQVVVASGAWAGELLGQLGVSVPVRPVRGQMLLYRAEPGIVRNITMSRGHYLIPRRDGRVLVGSTLEDVGFDKSTTDEAREALGRMALELFPELAVYPLEKHWSGLRPAAPDGMPFIGPHPDISGLFFNVGHFRNGVVLGPASARLLADRLLNRHSDVLSPQQLFLKF